MVKRTTATAFFDFSCVLTMGIGGVRIQVYGGIAGWEQEIIALRTEVCTLRIFISEFSFYTVAIASTSIETSRKSSTDTGRDHELEKQSKGGGACFHDSQDSERLAIVLKSSHFMHVPRE